MSKPNTTPLLATIRFHIPEGLYLKDPESSELGQKIISGSIRLIDEIGFDAFTFRKLGLYIDSPEASVYRYFENKHRLLLYLTYWYWSWVEYRLGVETTNLASPWDRLKIALDLVTRPEYETLHFGHIDERKLHSVVINEAAKTYLNKEVDDDNREGAFRGYKRLVQHISDIVLEIKPGFKYPHMLVSTIIEGAHHQHFFARHLPSLTDQHEGEDTISDFYQQLIHQVLA